jgi:predicted nucleotidyltransferase
MGMTAEVKLAPDDLDIVREIVGRLLPPGFRTYVFGSRATGIRLRPQSDIDLAIEGPEPLTFEVESSLKWAFDESMLPMKVDIVDCARISGEFARIVRETRIPL